jgi:hypothetical protein
VIWFGPDEWLVTSTERAGEDLEGQLQAAIPSTMGVDPDHRCQAESFGKSGIIPAHTWAFAALDIKTGIIGPR